jgi:hypothetical protein
MAQRLKPGGGANQNQDEKKDHQIESGVGRSRHSDFEAPQANQAKGRPKNLPHPAGHPSDPNRKPDLPTDNTVPGGNRKKGSHIGRLDHD